MVATHSSATRVAKRLLDHASSLALVATKASRVDMCKKHKIQNDTKCMQLVNSAKIASMVEFEDYFLQTLKPLWHGCL